MNFFTQPHNTLLGKLQKAKTEGKKSSIKKLTRAIRQQIFLKNIRDDGGIGFFASDCNMVKEKLRLQGFKF